MNSWRVTSHRQATDHNSNAREERMEGCRQAIPRASIEMAKETHNYARFECPDCGKQWMTDYEQWVKSFRDYCREKVCRAKSNKEGTHPNWLRSTDRPDKPPKVRTKLDPATGKQIALTGKMAELGYD